MTAIIIQFVEFFQELKDKFPLYWAIKTTRWLIAVIMLDSEFENNNI